jgi:hypothetical protein
MSGAGLLGFGYLVLDGDPTPARARFSHWADDHIAGLAGDYTRLPILTDTETDSDERIGAAA